MSFDGFTSVLVGKIISQTKDKSKAGQIRIRTKVKFEDGSVLKSIEVGETYAEASLPTQKFVCHD